MNEDIQVMYNLAYRHEISVQANPKQFTYLIQIHVEQCTVHVNTVGRAARAEIRDKYVTLLKSP